MTDVLITHTQWPRNTMPGVSQQAQSSHQQHKQTNYLKNTRRTLPRVKNETSPRNESRKITVFRNGDRYFPGKPININPNNYANLNELMQELSSFVDLPYGVRRLFTPSKGSEVSDVNIIKDGASYVCASFEPFHKLEYASIPVPRLTFNIEQLRQPLQDFSPSHRSNLRPLPSIPTTKFGATNRFQGNQNFIQPLSSSIAFSNPTQRKVFGKTSKYTFDSTYQKPRSITIIKHGNEKPHKSITILLNRRAMQSYEQLLSDISEAFGYQKNRQDKVKRLFTLKGRQVNGLNDFFREEDVFVASTTLTDPTVTDLQEINIEILNETHNSTSRGGNMPKNARKTLNQSPGDRDTPNTQGGTSSVPPPPIDLKKIASVRDSGFLDDEDGLSSRGSELTTARKTPSRPINNNNIIHQTVSEDTPTPNDLISRKLKKAPLKANNGITNEQQRERLRLRDEDERRKKLLMRTDHPNLGIPPAAKYEPLAIDLNVDESRPVKSKTPTTMAASTTGAFSPRFSTPAASLGKNPGKPTSTTPLPRINIPPTLDENNPNANEIAKSTPSASLLPAGSVKKFVIKKRSTVMYPSSSVVTDKYELGKKMGDGNFAIVHRSKFRGTDREYAIKIIDKSKMRSKEYMLDHEINIMYMCNHPNIIRLFEDYETPTEIYLVMELIKGGDLFDYITKHRRFDEPTASLMIKDVAEALLYLHAKKIVHRDLKPENLLVMQRKDGRITIKLTDFGLAMEVTGLIKTVCGTPTYVAPEILAEIGYGFEVDCWATGIILYILLCGYPPFKTPDRKQEELFQLIQRGKYTYDQEYWSSVSSNAKDLIDHLLVVDRHKRMRAEEILVHHWILTVGQSKVVRNIDEAKLLLRSKNEAKIKEYAAESTGP